MSERNNISRDAAIDANIYVHSSIVADYDNEPHFRPENKKKVAARLMQLMSELPKGNRPRLLDFGCGTGFIINLVREHCDRVDGVDVTQAMLDKIDISSGNVFLHNGPAEETPFEGALFDMATAYSFMDHLVDYNELLREGHRILKPGGIFYIDLNPNRKYWRALEKIDNCSNDFHSYIKDEVYAAVHNDERVSEQYNIDKDKLIMAEPEKTQSSGFDAQEVLDAAKYTGFSKVSVRYHWYLAQAKVMHQQSFSQADDIDEHLHRLLPLTEHLFKYLEFVFVK